MSNNGIYYLRVIGKLYPDNRLKLRPSYLTKKPRRPEEDPNGKVYTELYDDSNNILLRYRLSTRYYSLKDGEHVNLSIRGEIPFPSRTRKIKFFKDDVLLHELNVPKGKPKISITWKPPAHLKGTTKISWTGKHEQEDQKIQYFLRYTPNNGKTWQRLGWRTSKEHVEVNFDELPGGNKCRIAVVATDGVNTVVEESEVFSVYHKTCQPLILEPKDDDSYFTDQTVVFRGQGYYLEEGTAERNDLVWKSSIDKKLGVGMLLEIRNLSPGVHTISLMAGIGKRAGESTIKINIKDKQ